MADTLGVEPGFNLPDPSTLPSLKDKVSAEEWRLRCELAATYRLVALYGWDDMIFTHISSRLPAEDGEARFLLNPYGLFFDEITASSLIKVDMQGNAVQETPYFTNPAGFTIHSALHMSRADAHCVLHTHTPHGVAVSAQQYGLRRYSQFAMIVHDDVAYHDYEGIATDLDERARLVRDMGNHGFLILRNHGALTVGANCATAFLRMYFLEQACKAQILAQSDVKEPREEPPAMGAKVLQQGAPAFAAGMGDNLAWPGLMRKLKRENPGWDV
ncbi:MAG: class II aldolase [Alphaproteobacteria bacterium RIFCSPHIGHO2_12_FULL_63_12]|nr:MAG: class II aldolase [Alphaproteobacteria bacterium RIFCSPHIGHO2_12_FULL_63_12]